MKTKTLLKIMCLTAILVFSQVVRSQTMDITVKNIRNINGKLVVMIFTNEEEFKTEKPSDTKIFDKTNVKTKTCTISFAYNPGVYGLSIYDDENSNGKMDYNFLGIPKEGFGFSDFMLNKLSRPVFSDFSFQLKANENKTLTVEMKYM